MRRHLGVGFVVAGAATLATIVSPAPQKAEAAFPAVAGRIAMAVARPGSSTEIWTVSPAGTRLRLVLRAKTDVVAPAWSADGRRLAVVIAGSVWRVNGDGQRLSRVTGRAVVDAESPAWSPDGKEIAFAARTRGSNFDIYVCRTDGSNLRRLTRSVLPDEHPTWSPDGKRIVFARAISSVRSDLWSMNASGTAQRRIGYGGAPDWSPDGKLIALTLGRGIALIRPDGTAFRRIVDGPGIAGDPAWSPDGRRIAFWSDRAGNEATKGDLYFVTTDGESVTRVTDQPEFWHFDPSWQPLPRHATPRTGGSATA